MPEKIVTISITIERDHDGEFRSIIHAGSTEMWQSNWCKDATTAMQRASGLINAMPTDCVSAAKNHKPLRADHPNVMRWK